MSHSIYVVGAPGTGKSTLLDELVALKGWTWLPDHQVHRETWVNDIGAWYSSEKMDLAAIALGKRRDTYGGTDALARSASPHVLEYLRSQEGQLPPYVLGEGVRLTSVGFLAELHRMAPLTLVWLTADEDTLEERRGEAFSTSYRTSLQTRAYNVANRLWLLGIPVFKFNTTEMQPIDIARAVWSRNWRDEV